MKINVISKLSITAALAMTLAACGTTNEVPEEDSGMDTSTNTEATITDNSAVTTTGVGTEAPLSAQELREQQMLQTTVFYFDFDRSELKPEAREALVYHANRLKANTGMSVRLEGHGDERGTREYNLALGERRAQAVERYLQVQGVSSRQMETVSYGEEQPEAAGTSESAYARNRRVEMQF